MNITNEGIENEVGRIYRLLNKLTDEYEEIYENIDKYVKSYVFGKSVSPHRGYYNPSTVAHIAIGGNQKGPRPKKDPPKSRDGTYIVYGLDDNDRPIYVYSMISNDRTAKNYEIISYFEDSIIGITFYDIDFVGIHETRYENDKVKSIISCSFGSIGDPELFNSCGVSMEMFEYHNPTHFTWRHIDYTSKLLLQEAVKGLEDMFVGVDLTKGQIREIKNEFETNENGKLLRIYNDYYEKILDKKSLELIRKQKMNLLNTKKSEEIFTEMLNKSEITTEDFNLEKFSDLVIKFMDIKFNCAEDDLLFETGVFETLYGKDTFSMDFVRQFSKNDENDVYEYMEQLHITLIFKNNEKLTNLSCAVWSIDYDSQSEFLQEVRKLKPYMEVSKGAELNSISISFSKV